MAGFAVISIRIVLIFAVCCHAEDRERATFKAAVYEHAVILSDVRHENASVSRATALRHMMRNLDIYRNQAEIAARQGVDIMVFPEDGIYGMGFTRKALTAYLEYIPDPKNESWSACSEPNRYPNTDVQRFLSCLAKNNSMFLVANFGDKQPCSKDTHPSCPSDGHFQFNTDVVYNTDGTLIAKYHKVNLFFEYQFDFPPVTEVVTFNTPFGLFGIFTCFDIIFHDPAIDLINLGVKNIVFPTAWMDALPLLGAVQFHSAFARGMGLNFLSANINWPLMRFHGSGIYTPDGVLTYYYNDRQQMGQLLISDVPVIRSETPGTLPLTSDKDASSTIQWQHIPMVLLPPQDNTIYIGKRAASTFSSFVFHDLFTFKLLDDVSAGSLSVCNNVLCCYLDYDRDMVIGDVYAFGAFDGLHTYQGSYYMQVCTLLRCQGLTKSSCGRATTEAKTHFRNMRISGNFSSPYVFPEVLTYQNGSLAVPLHHTWTYTPSVLSVDTGFLDPVVSAGLFGRVYTKMDTNGHDEAEVSRQNN
ncbi:pantetheinase-like [Mizuhopecten yessoensis]|uniref:Pantetheinase n=1 Tax=Mizuhopecten yessoensis TaxID=6573 RepID=A0A210Q6K1_MIZYE|nr:pantetheinase-like [Mizuhopecten yessoensis]OWF44335.1 Pantetheinase [Mizuhopecten yessoensis]